MSIETMTKAIAGTPIPPCPGSAESVDREVLCGTLAAA
jgi:hypothetical protein